MYVKEAAIGSVVKSKQAVEGIKDIFKIADAWLGKTLAITNEEEAYAWAASDIENDEMVKGIWAMAFADAEGDEKKQKALYIKDRAKKLLDELQRRNLDKSSHGETMKKWRVHIVYVAIIVGLQLRNSYAVGYTQHKSAWCDGFSEQYR